MTLRAAANARRTLRAGFTTVRNLGLFVKTGGYLLDVALAEAIEAGWVDGPRVIPAGHAICPTGGHLDPSAQNGLAPHIMPLSVEEGIADGVDEVRKAVRYQIKHGAKLIKCVGSGGVMTPTGPPGAQQYSADELAAIADEAHRRGLRVAIHCHGDVAVNAAIDAGIDCIEHGTGLSDDGIAQMAERGTALVPTMINLDNFPRYATPARDKFPSYYSHMMDLYARRKQTIGSAIEAGVPVYAGTDAGTVVEHGRIRDEIEALAELGGTEFALGAASWGARAWLGADVLAEGSSADLIVLDADPREDLSTLRRPRALILRGTVVG